MFQIVFNSTWIWEQLYCVGDRDHRSGKGEREACGGCGRSNYGEKPHTHKVWTSREISSAFGPIGTRSHTEVQRNLGAEIHLRLLEQKSICANLRNPNWCGEEILLGQKSTGSILICCGRRRCDTFSDAKENISTKCFFKWMFWFWDEVWTNTEISLRPRETISK